MLITEEDRDILIGALQSLGVALADHHHKWTEGECAIFEQACQALGISCDFHK